PSRTDHVTARSGLPSTAAVNCVDAPGASLADSGEMLTETIGMSLTVIVAVAILLASALLAATTWNVPVVAGATYIPSAPMDPPGVPSRTDHLTDVSAVPETAAVKRCVPAVGRLTD